MSLAVKYAVHGEVDVLQVVEVAEPHAEAGQVRVAVKAAGLNPYDIKARRAVYGQRKLPSGQGAEFAGVVDEVGDGVTTVSVGDEVLGWTSFAAQAEHVVVKAERVAPKPSALDWAVAGGIGLVGNTALRSTRSLGLGPKDTVLVTAAAGGVGLLAVQFARAAGATVIATASPANHEFLRSLGAIPVAYGDGELERLREASPHGYTAMLDNHGRHSVLLGLELGIRPERINSIADSDELGIQTVGGGGKTAEELAWLANGVASGELQFPILATFPLDQVQDAYRLLETGHGLGKIVLTVP
ncbi:MAG TPA: NADP-dependent oxidoreductase [Homoserinimonas sp.]|nr:NADP-dependent oxidoreductase [Homoserinimonas sp.]